MATFQYIAGYINPESMQQHKDLAAWGQHWQDKAVKAQAMGNELVVYEIPTASLLYALWGAAGITPGDRPPFEGAGILHELIMPIDDLE